MRLSELLGSRYKERPAEAVLDSHAFMLRGGYMRQVANGIYSLLPPALRVARKIERIIREEMDRIGGQEVLMPVVLPRELWEESGRYEGVGSELLRFRDRTGHDMLLGMTHEEAVVHLCRNEISSYAQLPFMVYQIQTKFRDEPRSRGGLIRVREFTMKDAYSFHTSWEDLREYYEVCYRAYQRIFARAGVPEVAVVVSDSGMMGGKVAHEFMLLTEVGEDSIVTCDTCKYIANLEVAEGRIEAFVEAPKPLEKVHTPGYKTIEEVAGFLGVETRQTAKVVFYESDSEGKLVVLLIRGDIEVNEIKLAKIIQAVPVPATEAKIVAAGSVAGYASPMSLDREKVRIVVDHTIAQSNNLVAGANEKDYHVKHFNLARDLPGIETVDVANVRENDGCRQCTGRLHLTRGIEVGNIFQLGTKYTESMAMTYLDENGKACHPIMGCYGIGVGRLVSSVIEARHDKFGPRWPMSVAPWQVHINALNATAGDVKEVAETLYADLKAAGIEVVYDDRNERPGVQFADADLLGVPIRLVVSERNLKNGALEYKRRDTGDQGTIPVAEAVETARRWIAEAVAEIEGIADTFNA
ncbi:MAG TPA: proline--tRNA ligase [Candidatus Hydrogenedentes bacterium]|nr:proline--tRNA ligase [Candidatus Hydrogenedentota bacterium]HPG68173.1 proline--tRNA ligase [Candidatus Hydrogenedentota bacterium]